MVEMVLYQPISVTLDLKNLKNEHVAAPVDCRCAPCARNGATSNVCLHHHDAAENSTISRPLGRTSHLGRRAGGIAVLDGTDRPKSCCASILYLAT